MKVIVNFPELDDDKIELENRVADFHATLLLEKIKQLNLSDTSRKKIFNSVLEHLNEKCMRD